MLDSGMEEKLNVHMNMEFQAEYAYLSMAAYFAAQDLAGCEKWMRAQADEERTHAMKFFDYIEERGGRVELLPLSAPPKDYPSVQTVFETALAHEQKVTAAIHGLVDHAMSLKDHPTFAFLQWFVDEQVEEEATIGALVAQLNRIGGSGPAMNQFDRHLARPE